MVAEGIAATASLLCHTDKTLPSQVQLACLVICGLRGLLERWPGPLERDTSHSDTSRDCQHDASMLPEQLGLHCRQEELPVHAAKTAQEPADARLDSACSCCCSCREAWAA